MKKERKLKFTGILIILGVVAYLALIANTARSSHSSYENNTDASAKSSVLDTTVENPFSNIYQKASFEKQKKKNELLNK